MSTVQSILFDKNIYNVISARQWLARHNFKPIKDVDITANKLRFRIRAPIFNNYITKKLNDDGSIEAIIGFR